MFVAAVNNKSESQFQIAFLCTFYKHTETLGIDVVIILVPDVFIF